MSESLKLPNLAHPVPGIVTAGMPKSDQLQQLAAAGLRTVVNLCPPAELSVDEQKLVEAQGLRYVNIPVAGAADLNVANARQLAEIVDQAANQPVLVHCMSSNRVGALFALKAYVVDGRSPEEAIEAGRAAGLKGLEPTVRGIMAQQPRS